MKFQPKLISLSIVSVLSLSGCLEVEDDSNQELVNSLNQQNAILAEQNELLANQEQAGKTVTVTGTIFDITTDTPVTSAAATIEVIRGDELLMTAQSNENGAFTIEDLPAASDLTLYVSFADNQFMARAFFITTPSANNANAFDDIGYLDVSVPVTVSFTVLDSSSGESVSGLKFLGYSHQGTSSKTYDYAHVATYDETTGLYSVTLPKDINVTLQALIDDDGDNQRDFEIDFESGIEAYVSGTYLTIASANNIQETAEVTLSPVQEAVDTIKNIYITLIDGNGAPLEGAQFSSDEPGFRSTYNAETQLYELTLPYDGYISFTMSSLNTGDSVYSAGSVSISNENSQTQETSLRISSSGFNSNSFYTIDDATDINLVLVGRPVYASSELEVVATFFSSETYTNTIYYSQPINVAEENIRLTYNDIDIVFGNDSTDDTVPEGFTDIYVVKKEVPVAIELASNDAKLSITPQTELLSNTSYTYTVGAVAAQSDDIEVELSADDKGFTTSINLEIDVFDINDVFIDNNNYYSNGTILVAENTAGVPSTRLEYRDTPRLYFPTTIESLNYLIFRQVSYTRNNDQYFENRTYGIVIDGDVNNSNRYIGLKAASNETLSDTYIYNYDFSLFVATGSTLETGRYAYRVSTNLYSMDDNKAGSVNSVTFNYEYQTKDGVTEKGTITLPVR